jgi:hypothetical protein
MKRRFCLIAVLLASCSSDPLDVDVGGGPLIQTNASTYVLTRREGLLEVSIPVRFENRLTQTIYLRRCPDILPPVLERKYGDEWRTAWTAPVYCVSDHPFPLAPGAVHVDTIHVYAHPFGDVREPQFQSADVTGIHRLQWNHALRSYDTDRNPPGEQLPLRHRISNEFQLQGP